MKAVDQAYRSLRAGILGGRYEHGTRLGEVEVAELLGVSRTPVREALRQLNAEGLVELLPNRGARVATWTRHDIEEVYELRACLESYGATRATTRVTDEEIAYLSKLCEDEEALVGSAHDEMDKVLDIKAEYHRAIMHFSANQRLFGMTTPLIEVQSVLRTFRQYQPQRLSQQITEHRILVQAFQRRDAEWAAAAMRAHLIGAKEALLEDKRHAETQAQTGLGKLCD